MHLRRLMGLSLLAFVAAIGTEASTTNPSVPVSGTSTWDRGVHIEGGTGIPTTRFLRASAIGGGEDDGGEERARPAVPVVEKVKTLLSSSNVSPEKLQKWLNEGKSADSVFARMRLDKAEDWVLYRPQFATWLQYVDDLNAKNPAKGTSAISRLTAYYGDAVQYKMIDKALTISSSKTLAARLQKEQVQHWVDTARSPDDVFQFMSLDKIKRDILTSAGFTAWTKYIDAFKAKYPEKPALMAPVLMRHYRDATLFQMIEAAMNVGATKTIASKLEDEMIQVWLKSAKTPDDALVTLGLSHTVNSLLDSQLFSSWLKYTNAYSAKYPHEKATAIETLTRTFGDAKVTRMLITAKSKGATRDLASNLETAQLEMWQKSKKSVNDVLELLDLRFNMDFTKNPLLNAWVSYMDVLLKENPGTATDMLLKLQPHFGDRSLSQILQAAMKFPSMEIAATQIQTEKIKSYLAGNQSPENVFKWLNLDNLGDNLLGDPIFSKWMKYAEDFNKKNPMHQESWFTTIRMNYHWNVEGMIERAMQNPSTVNVAKRVEREWLKYWLDRKKLPKDAFHFLHLEKTGAATLASPKFETWAKYLNDFNQRYPDEKTTMIDGLRANYNDINLLRMFEEAKKDAGVERLAANLENALVNKWVAEKEPVAVLRRRFGYLPTGDDMVDKYAKKLNALPGNTL